MTWKVRCVLICGILGVSSAAVLVRRLEEAELGALGVAGWRMGLAALLLLLPALRTPVESAGRRPWLVLLAVVSLALHFGLWTASLYRIPVARASILVATQPIFVMVTARVFLGERPPARSVAFAALAIAGAVWMVARTGFEGGDGVGDLMAVGGGAVIAGYVLAGRALRRTMPLARYVVPVYGGAAALLLGAAAITGGASSLVPERDAWPWLVALAVLPTLCGHTLFNWALRFAPARMVSTAFLGEPVGATLLAWLLLSESPPAHVIIGGALCLCGVLGVVLTDRE